jgi:ATP-dependent helicase/nuclease subunit B
MSGQIAPRVLSIPPGLPFLSTLADALLSGRLVPGFAFDEDPLRLSDATIFVPTRRSARALRSVFVDRLGKRSAILPVIRPLGDFDEDAALFESDRLDGIDMAPPVGALDRLLLLAPLVQAWKGRLPAHVAAMFEEEVVVPASLADCIWLARDLATLMDEVETEGADWAKLDALASGDLAGWWQVTLEFLSIVTRHWPQMLVERQRSNPAAYRSAMIDAEAERLIRNPPAGPIVAAGSTGSIPATARLISAIARLPAGAVVLPGLDMTLDEHAWSLVGEPDGAPSVRSHPQYGLKKLIGAIGISRGDVEVIGEPRPELAARAALISEALRPAETTDFWAGHRSRTHEFLARGALAGVALAEAANERDEAMAIALALRRAAGEGKAAALVTGDRTLARRVSAELLRFGISADDSGGMPLVNTPPAVLLRLVLECALAPGDPLAILALLKHPLCRLGLTRTDVRAAAETIELVTLRGGTGRPDLAALAEDFEARLAQLSGDKRRPSWLDRFDLAKLGGAREVLHRLKAALEPLEKCRGAGRAPLTELTVAAVRSLESVGRGLGGDLGELYAGDAGEKLAEFLRSLLAVDTPLTARPTEWPAALGALVATATVRPSAASESRVTIWGALEARLQTVDTLVIGGLNEGSWPGRAEADRFMSRMMKGEMSLEPPERRTGLAAHDFMMAMGAERVVLTRSARAGEAPSLASRWLQRLLTCAGENAAGKMRAHGDELLAWARLLDEGENVPFAARPRPSPPIATRPRHFSVTEIETLRRDPYAIYAKRVLKLQPLEPLIRDPGVAERGSLFHDILHRFILAGVDPLSTDAPRRLAEIGRQCFDEAALPADVEAVWWPRFKAMVDNIVAWERCRARGIEKRYAEVRAGPIEVEKTGVTLSGYADRIDLRAGGVADILDYKTGGSPSKGQAHTLLAPQLALEGALLKRGAFSEIGAAEPSELAYIRLKGNGDVLTESILEFNKNARTASELSQEAWRRLEQLLQHYNDPASRYLSRALPFREGDMDGDYDHLARVLEWSAGADGDENGGEGGA